MKLKAIWRRHVASSIFNLLLSFFPEKCPWQTMLFASNDFKNEGPPGRSPDSPSLHWQGQHAKPFHFRGFTIRWPTIWRDRTGNSDGRCFTNCQVDPIWRMLLNIFKHIPTISKHGTRLPLGKPPGGLQLIPKALLVLRCTDGVALLLLVEPTVLDLFFRISKFAAEMCIASSWCFCFGSRWAVFQIWKTHPKRRSKFAFNSILIREVGPGTPQGQQLGDLSWWSYTAAGWLENEKVMLILMECKKPKVTYGIEWYSYSMMSTNKVSLRLKRHPKMICKALLISLPPGELILRIGSTKLQESDHH